MMRGVPLLDREAVEVRRRIRGAGQALRSRGDGGTVAGRV